MLKSKSFGWAIRDKYGKRVRAIFFCGKSYVPQDDRHEVLRCRVNWKIVKNKKIKR